MPLSGSRRISCYFITLIFITSGVLHFARPEMYLAIMPPYIPFHRVMVYSSGVFELLGGLGVLWHDTQRWAGYGLVALLVAVFPANIHMALHPNVIGSFDVTPLLLWLRLPLQFLLIAWVIWATRPPTNTTSASRSPA